MNNLLTTLEAWDIVCSAMADEIKTNESPDDYGDIILETAISSPWGTYDTKASELLHAVLCLRPRLADGIPPEATREFSNYICGCCMHSLKGLVITAAVAMTCNNISEKLEASSACNN